MAESRAKKKSVAITWIRALSVLYIVGFWHLQDYATLFALQSNPALIRVTIAVLAMFVLVSGFLVGGKTVPLNRPGLLQFYRTRLLRIYPPYLAAHVLFLVLHLSRPRSIANGALLISMLHAPPPLTLWFIGLIIVFYAVTPGLAALAKYPTKFAAVCGAFLAVAWAYGYVTHELDARVLLYFPTYAAGVFLAHHRALLARVNLPALALAVIVSVGLSLLQPMNAESEVSLYAVPFALCASVFCLAFMLRIESRLPSFAAIGYLSTASYFMYLFHRPIYVLLRRGAFPHRGLTQFIYLLGVCLPLVIGISWLGQMVYDGLFARWHARKTATA